MGEECALGIGEMGDDEVGNGYVGNGHVDPNRFWLQAYMDDVALMLNAWTESA